jgi:primosomal protein N' (replication factor Y)
MPRLSTQNIEVAIPLPLDQTFTYRLPEQLFVRACIGMRVLVPFGRRKVTGYIVAPAESGAAELKEVIELLDSEPLLTLSELEFLRWIANYYQHPLGEVLKAALPAGINITSRQTQEIDHSGKVSKTEVLVGGKKTKQEAFYCHEPSACAREPRGRGKEILQHLQGVNGATASELKERFGPCSPQLKRLLESRLISVTMQEVYRDPFSEEVGRDTPLDLNSDQAGALDRIRSASVKGAFAPFLLHGVTGSGKTEVYLQAIAHTLALGRRALVLVPEIALTPQLVKRFRRRFDCSMAVLHSGLAEGERYDEWRRIRRGEADIVIGARSAIFAPLQRIGIIVVDEEHEGSYKQSEGLRYNARDLALVRGKMAHAVVLLGSATPLLTTYHAAEQGKIGYLELPRRVRDLPMPEVTILDGRGKKGNTFLPELQRGMADNLEQGGQTLLFLNRRGFATYIVCQDCGNVLHCPNCAVTLTYHQGKRGHFCHYCGYSIPAPSLCPGCNSTEIGLLGRGTERVEAEVQELFPTARVSRMDRDTTTGRGGHARLLRGLEEGRIDILIGTQMIAKGHDFPGVTLVGVVSVDSTLNLPDFRSAERAFQLVSQVLGRAGRGDAPGRVLIQTLLPDHYAITHAAAHDFRGFCAKELEFRSELGYPPFAHLAAIVCSGTAAKSVEDGAEQSAALLHTLKRDMHSRVEVLGPAVAPLGKIRGRFRRQIVLKCASRPDLHRLVARFRREVQLPATVRLQIDIDPVEML